MSDRLKFQGLCLVSTNGYESMSSYDNLPPDVRQRLCESPFNLCPACVAGWPDPYARINQMEHMLRCEVL